MSRILIATDGSEVAIDAAVRTVKLLGAEHDYTVLTVREAILPTSTGGLYGGGIEAVNVEETLYDATAARAEDAVERTVGAMRTAGAGASGRIEDGTAAEMICTVAADEGFDLIALGSHGSGMLRRLFLGSVSRRVTEHAPCPVLVVRESNDEG